LTLEESSSVIILKMLSLFLKLFTIFDHSILTDEDFSRVEAFYL